VKTVLVLPSLKVSGGTYQALRLLADLVQCAQDGTVLCLWTTPFPVNCEFQTRFLSSWRSVSSRAFFQLPLLAVRFARIASESLCGGSAAVRFIFTHYATLPLLLLVPRRSRYVFVQDLEWKFLSNPWLSSLVRAVVLFFYRRCSVVSANRYLTCALRDEGVAVSGEMPIWADASFLLSDIHLTRDVDFAMVLRKGDHKRLDLYMEFIDLVRHHGAFRIAVISPEDEILSAVSPNVAITLARPSIPQMRSLYGRTKCFIHLSDHEGFGLPPLEAMGAGCVPICRDSGGVRAFMQEELLSALLVPIDAPIADIVRLACEIARDSERLETLATRSHAVFKDGLNALEHRAADMLHVSPRASGVHQESSQHLDSDPRT
jgi:glycosyltransferase involved in cell wall biosynthesis